MKLSPLIANIQDNAQVCETSISLFHFASGFNVIRSVPGPACCYCGHLLQEMRKRLRRFDPPHHRELQKLQIESAAVAEEMRDG